MASQKAVFVSLLQRWLAAHPSKAGKGTCASNTERDGLRGETLKVLRESAKR